MQLRGLLFSKGLGATSGGPLSCCVRTDESGWEWACGGRNGWQGSWLSNRLTVHQKSVRSSQVPLAFTLRILHRMLQLLRWASCCTTVGATGRLYVNVRLPCSTGILR